ncbi:hypothetical protein Pmani_011857 [Petrolisthes manimaculis]|uniref:Chitin-binding type-2 domain-containing protein n=1 Tax=Petrolisthes manimaculis TaxID=1843537 RepID=A0AAE1UF92_9EUCA|nr:hypothetical protein Pmani_011857 [Petrolisthes manimaculis]
MEGKGGRGTCTGIARDPYCLSSLHLSRTEECPGDHVCSGMGIEIWNEETNETVLCMGASAPPLCPETSEPSPTTSPQTTPSTSPQTTSTTSPDTTSTTSPQTTPSTSPEMTPTTSPETTSTTSPEMTSTTSPQTTSTTSTEMTSTTSPETTSTTSTDTTSTTGTSPETTSTTSPDTTGTTTLPCDAPATCEGKVPNELYYHQECNCKMYYVCRYPVLGGDNLILYEYSCFNNEVFDPSTNQCTADTSVCPYY